MLFYHTLFQRATVFTFIYHLSGCLSVWSMPQFTYHWIVYKIPTMYNVYLILHIP